MNMYNCNKYSFVHYINIYNVFIECRKFDGAAFDDSTTPLLLMYT